MNAEEKKRSIRDVKRYIEDSDYEKAFSLLCAISSPQDDFSLQAQYAKCYSKISYELQGLHPIKIAILATNTVSHLNESVLFWLAKEGFSVELFESDFDVIHQTTLDPKSRLYEFAPDITVFFTSYRDIKSFSPSGATLEDVENTIKCAVDDVKLLWSAVRKNCNSHIIQTNADIPAHRVFGNYEGSVAWSRQNFLRRFNLELPASKPNGVSILDLEAICSNFGVLQWHDHRYWYHSRHAFSLDAIGYVAFELSKLIGAIKGMTKKCLVLDLDNTLWGGVVGDDGVDKLVLGYGPVGEAFVDFQKFILSLKDRGVILAVCSKNEESIAKQPFLRHPDMQLKLEDISVFKANWNNKAENIIEIAKALNIGLDSLVFVDDNPVERGLVRELLPVVSVPEMPNDPAEFISAICEQSYFEIDSFSMEDRNRSSYYQENAARKDYEAGFDDISAYLKSLRMVATAGMLDQSNLARAVQLINKTNQFNLTTIRYTETEVLEMMADPKTICRYFKLADKFGDNGLISVIILKQIDEATLLIDTWVMSCRVFSRGMEEFVLNDLAAVAESFGYTVLCGKYLKTNKNKPVEDLYDRLGFSLIKSNNDSSEWKMELSGRYKVCDTFIKRSDESK